MSTENLPHDPHAHDAGHHDATAPDQTPVNAARIIMIGVVSIAVFAIGSVWALRIMTATEKQMNPTGPAAIPAALRNEENGIVDFVPFELNKWVPKDREAARAQLVGYAWIDQKAGKLRLPIDRAMQMVVAEQGKWAHEPAEKSK